MVNWSEGGQGALGGAATGAAIGSVVPGWGTAIGGAVGGVIGGLGGLFGGDDEQAKADALRKQQLAQMSAQAQANYAQLGQRGYGALDYLQGQAQGQNSVSAEQLRQGLQQLYGQQRSMAAGASPRNAALAARTASIQSARLGAGMAGQQALAGIAERNQAQQAYAQLLQGLRGQELNASLGSSAPQQIGPPPKSFIEEYGPAIQGAMSAYAATRKPAAVASAPSGGGGQNPNSYGLINPYA